MADFPGTAGDDLIDGTATADTISDGGAGNDTLNGGDGDDVITTSGGTDSIDGGAGTDRLVIDASASSGVSGSVVTGIGSGSVVISGNTLTYQNIEGITYTGFAGTEIFNFGQGNHVIDMRGGNDILFITGGSSSINGNAGFDTVNYRAATAGVTADLVAGTVIGATVADTITSIERFIGSDFGDLLIADSATIELGGVSGNDVLDTGGRIGAIDLAGGDGDDVFVIRSGAIATISAANTFQRAGIDRVETDIASFTLTTGVEDLEYFGSGAFTGTGNDVANVIVGGGMGDTISGLGGDDTLAGEGGNDILNGGDGNDRLIGGTGIDQLSGGAGNDILVVSDSSTFASGGDGIDTMQIVTGGNSYTLQSDVENASNLSSGSAVVTLNSLANTYGGGAGIDIVSGGSAADMLYGRGGNDELNGDAGNDRLFGDTGNDTLNGGDDNDMVYGGADNDLLSGGAGSDTLYGEAGTDTLSGGSGLDLLYGGSGADSFAFDDGDSGATLATADRILDFSQAQSDRLNLSAIDARAGGADNAFSFIGVAAFGSVSGQLRYQQSGGNTFVEGDVNGDGVADFIIRIDGLHALSATDFVL